MAKPTSNSVTLPVARDCTPSIRVATILLHVAAATIVVFSPGVASQNDPERISSSLRFTEHRRMSRTLLEEGTSSPGTTQGADVAQPTSQEASASLITVLGEKHLKCEVELKQCKADLQEAQKSCSENSLAEDSSSKDKFITSLLRENKKLKQQLQFLRRSTSGSSEATRELLTTAEGDKDSSLVADNLSLAADMIGSGQSEAHANGATSTKETPGSSSTGDNAAMESAKKALEECGPKQGVTAVKPGDKAYACEATEEELKQYFNYTPRAECPDDWYFVQKLVYIKNCFCLPKRRCYAPSPSNYREPSIPFPKSLFDPDVLSNDNVRWTKMYWPSYEALNTRVRGDCRDCFNLTLEATRWEVPFYGTIPIEKMLALKGNGSIKIGLDAGGGTGSFAAKMAQHGVTIVTTAMNTETLADKEGGLPYMETIAQRGLMPLFVPHKVRQPFFDGTLDIVHNINSIKYFTIPEFEELLFEWDRILRPGGVMWFELFYAPVSEMPLYISVIEMFGYKKLYWNMTPKEDAAERNDQPHVYLNCVLEKPRRPENSPPLEPAAVSEKIE